MPYEHADDRRAKKAKSAQQPARAAGAKGPDRVQEASEESFPASDPPAHGAPAASVECEPKPAPSLMGAAPKGVDKVDEASEESFPASDPPGGTSHV